MGGGVTVQYHVLLAFSISITLLQFGHQHYVQD
jgi:hypothetical protein